MTDIFEEKFNTAVAKAKKAQLLQTEKEGIKSQLLYLMKEHPNVIDSKHLPAKKEKRWFARFTEIAMYRTPVVRFAFLVCMVIGIGGIGLSVAAQKTLPGDLLYPIKTKITEKALALTLFSDQAKAEYDIDLAQLRLYETETIAAQNRLTSKSTEEVKTLLMDHLLDIQSRIIKLTAKEDARIALQLKAQLESVLKEHARTLDILATP